VTDRQKQTQTDTRTKANGFYRACLESRGKNRKTKTKKTMDLFRSIGKQSGESMESVLKKKRKGTVGRIYRKGKF